MTPLSHYTCQEAFGRIDDFLDRELSTEERALVEEHLAVCERCAEEFRFEASVLQGVRTKVRQIDVPADLQARVLRALEAERGAGG